MQKDKEAKGDMKAAAAAGHEVADKLKEEGLEKLAAMVNTVVEEVERALEGEMDIKEVEDALAAAKVRAKGKEEEAAKMDEMVGKLEAAAQAHHEAGDLKKEAELKKEADDAAKQQAEAAGVAGQVASELEAAGFAEEAAQAKEWQTMLEGDHATGADIEHAAKKAHELAAKLRAKGKKHEADEAEKLASLLDAAAQHKLEVEGMQKDKEAKGDMKAAAAVGHEVADKLREEGFEELADMVDTVVEEVEHALEGEMDIEEA